MFDFLKKTDNKIYAPVDGELVSLEEVNDMVFSSKMMGDGFAIKHPTSCICAPCDGQIETITPMHHAVGMKAKNGSEIIIHCGLDTVNLNGKGFTVLKNKGDRVKKGDALLKVDYDFIHSQNLDDIVIVVITNSKDLKLKFDFDINQIEKGKTAVVEVVQNL